MKGFWQHFTRYFEGPSGMATFDSCRVVEAMIPMIELYGVDLYELTTPQPRGQDENR
ncbi:hypothetical protein [Erwinia aphidicola]|uniref:hypothetical protein n=1 Tax=Erwinia aphidicola TaxID=68334 RepID=UPI003CF8BCDA